MYSVSNFLENRNVEILDQMDPFQIVEYQQDLSVSPSMAVTAYFCAKMNIRKRQLVCDLSKSNVTIQAGAARQC